MDKQVTWKHLVLTNALWLIVSMLMLFMTRGCNKIDANNAIIAGKASLPEVIERDKQLKDEMQSKIDALGSNMKIQLESFKEFMVIQFADVKSDIRAMKK